MEKLVNKIIEKLKAKNLTVSTMESCTGGLIGSTITNVSGASYIFKFGAITYSNEFKIKLGGNLMEDTIKEYGVYSKETAEVMAEMISKYADSSYGIGVTGQIGTADSFNESKDNVNDVYFSIYFALEDTFQTVYLNIDKGTKEEKKKLIAQNVLNSLLDMLD